MAEAQNGAAAAPPPADHAIAAAVPAPPPTDPRDQMVIMLQQLGMGNLVCKLRKQVDASDAKPNQSRLQLTYQLARGLVESGDLTDGEKRLIHGGDGDDDDLSKKKKKKSSGLKLDGYDRHGRRYGAMRFGRVGSVDGKNGNGLYRLKSFGRFVAANGLRAGHTVVAWVFRLPPPPPPEEEEDAPARLAVMLLDYPSSDPAMVEAMVVWEDDVLEKFGAASGIVKISNAGN
ncbi:Os02g0166300 [Oryza sativa Japonica Group]|jgi:hypothetical protein|uniref:Uncharacterized protein n=4 Tax=Oryza TaxID=4527 RepID=A3A3H8_ORYSJ|nr:hypothetical protein OsI_05988 [Oryza sativa Indica Group]EAZ21867.1 hypothetical protein OsJ_05516 [Oryza sativa Japonica Group]BAD25559.1 hypothetical protein [Oryza sativa Japonica Group]BAD26228.1 hypothetical protein [Oryza sativa Japonica Group]BAS77152.1 Os02g0166300 [Oryza sativa Japonica Group]